MMKALLMNMMDNVAVALQPVQIKNQVGVTLDGDIRDTVTAKGEIPFGHKIAISDIMSGNHIVKYGEIIGCATQNIEKGEHVHVHNVKSIRGSAEQRKLK
jgi:altronate dehydratase small subunit